MIVESKKTKLRQSISEADWEQMKKSGDYLHFNVIKRGDDDKKPDPIPLPFVLEHIKRRSLQEMENAQKTDEPPKRKYKPTIKTKSE